MSKLDELLSPEPTKADSDAAMRFFREFGYEEESWSEDYKASWRDERLPLVRATLQEAAKLVCPLCDIGYPLVLGLNDGETGSQYEHENREYNQGKCPASFIHARLAKEKP